MNREQARKLISGLFDEAADDVDTERLQVMRRRVETHMNTAQQRGVYSKVLAALDLELDARGASESGHQHISPQTQAETHTTKRQVADSR